MLRLARISRGFTIIEVTIAITLITAGLILGMVAINARLKQENFYKGIGLFTTRVNDIVNDVSTNNWHHVDGWECYLPTTADNLEFRQKASHQTGEGDCLYIGKVIQFGDDRKVTEDDGQYFVHTILTHKNALIPIYNFDKYIAPLNGSQSQPLSTLEWRRTPGFSGREAGSWQNGIQTNQIYYLDGGQRIYLHGIAIVQLSAHGLTENDLLLLSGAGHFGIRVIRNQAQPENPAQQREGGDAFADSLKRIPWTIAGATTRVIDSNFSLPIYICLSDGRGNRALGLLGGKFGGLRIETSFDENQINNSC